MAKSQVAKPQDLAVQEKKELVSKEEKTVPARYYVQNTDIYETDDALTVVMEIPGVEKKDVEVNIENDVLRVEGRIDFANTRGWSRSTPSTMSATSPARLRCRTRSTSSRSAPRSMTAS